MAKEYSFLYDSFSDRLMISCKKDSDKIKGSLRVLNLIIDFTTKDKVANIELKKVSDYLKSLNINPDILNKLESVGLVFKQCRDGYLIYFLLKTKQGTEKIPYNIYSSKEPLLVK